MKTLIIAIFFTKLPIIYVYKAPIHFIVIITFAFLYLQAVYDDLTNSHSGKFMKDLPSLLAENGNTPDSVAKHCETIHEYWTAVWRSAVAHCNQIRDFMKQQTNSDPLFAAQFNALPHNPTLHEVKYFLNSVLERLV